MTTSILPVPQAQKPADSHSARNPQRSSGANGASFEDSMRDFENDVDASRLDESSNSQELDHRSGGDQNRERGHDLKKEPVDENHRESIDGASDASKTTKESQQIIKGGGVSNKQGAEGPNALDPDESSDSQEAKIARPLNAFADAGTPSKNVVAETGSIPQLKSTLGQAHVEKAVVSPVSGNLNSGQASESVPLNPDSKDSALAGAVASTGVAKAKRDETGKAVVATPAQLKEVYKSAQNTASKQTSSAQQNQVTANTNAPEVAAERLSSIEGANSAKTQTEESARSGSLANSNYRNLNLKDADIEQVKNFKTSDGSLNARKSDMHSLITKESTDAAAKMHRAFERPALVNERSKASGIEPGKPKAMKTDTGTSRVPPMGETIVNAPVSAESGSLAKFESFETLGSERSVMSAGQAAFRPFEVQIARQVNSSQPTDAVKAVQQAMDRIAEVQPSKMRFSLNMNSGERIDIQVIQRDGGLQVRLAAQSPELRDAITRSWDSLTQNAQSKGIRLVAPVIDTLPANPQSFDRGNTNQQQSSSQDRQAFNQENRGERQDSQSNARDREAFRESFRENLRENAQRRQAVLNPNIAGTPNNQK